LLLVAPAQPVVGHWDAARLEQVLTNLVDNAIKYSPKGGPVELRLRQHEGQAEVAVRDEGIGIAPDQIEHLFQAFFRVESSADRHTSGLGLGLHIAHELVRLHDGTITVESQPGQGSRFTVTLPLSGPRLAATMSARLEAENDA
jgi:signal transduction histidine kinase